MTHGNLVKGIFLMLIALAFGLGALRYPFGNLGRAGPGLFPMLVATLLGLTALAIIIRSFFVDKAVLEFHPRNIAIILGSLVGLALISMYVNMILGIAFLVFFSTLAGQRYSWVRNLKVLAGLLVVAFAFQRLLGLQLPLY